jgi:hypothetical protein
MTEEPLVRGSGKEREREVRDRIPKADRVSQRSVGRAVLARAWLPLVAVIALGVGAVCMFKVHEASAPGPVIAVNGPQAPEEFTPKQLTYELFGSIGDGGMLSVDYPKTVGAQRNPPIPKNRSEGWLSSATNVTTFHTRGLKF